MRELICEHTEHTQDTERIEKERERERERQVE
jgi:hypothetical protein